MNKFRNYVIVFYNTEKVGLYFYNGLKSGKPVYLQSIESEIPKTYRTKMGAKRVASFIMNNHMKDDGNVAYFILPIDEAKNLDAMKVFETCNHIQYELDKLYIIYNSSAQYLSKYERGIVQYTDDVLSARIYKSYNSANVRRYKLSKFLNCGKGEIGVIALKKEEFQPYYWKILLSLAK